MLGLFGWQYIFLLEERYTTVIANEGREKTHCIFGSLPHQSMLLSVFKASEAAKNTLQKLQVNLFVHILQDTLL